MSHHIHLPQSLLGGDVPCHEIKVMLVGGIDMRDSALITDYLYISAQAGDVLLTGQFRKTRLAQ